MLRHLLGAMFVCGTLALASSGAFACGQDVKDVQGIMPLAMLGDKAEAEAKALLEKAIELCNQGKAEEAKPLIDQARLVANFG